MSKLIPIIGLEIHVELKTKSKMFCGCVNDPFASQPNTHVCEICLGHPGTLPAPNCAAIVETVKIARALGCGIARESKFDRKHYFYPDLPKGYQISQYDQPIGSSGQINLDLELTDNARPRAAIGITRVHLEEDTAQLTHASGGGLASLSSAEEMAGERSRSLVNFNRAGVPLVEIVSEPDVESALEAKAYCQELQLIFRYLGVSNADMEKGQMRCEANVSVQEEGKFKKANGTIIGLDGYKLNNKVEVKNINSFRAVEKAIQFEIKRQTELLARGKTWPQETRGWDDPAQATISQRVKETSADYRYFPEPDIPPFNPQKIAGDIALPELPQAKRERFHNEYGFSLADAYLLTADTTWADFTEETVSELADWLHSLPETHECVLAASPTRPARHASAGVAGGGGRVGSSKTGGMERPAICKPTQELARLAGGWLTSKLMGAMNERKIDIRILKIKPENFAELIALIYANRVGSNNAQKILIEMLESGVDLDPTHIMEEKGFGQISDEKKISAVVDEIIKQHPQQVTAFKAGKEPLIKFLIGMAMKATEGSADPTVVEKLLRQKLA